MNRICLWLLALFAVSAQAIEPEKSIAITIDDLPWVDLDRHTPPGLGTHHARLMSALRQAKAPVVGFVNEDKLEADGVVQPDRVGMLRDWLALGAELGNHTYGHVDLHAAGLPVFQEAVLKGERVLRPLLAEQGQTPRWLRHPYLRAGEDVATREALANFLSGHGYRVAPVTIDNSDWIWARAYRRALDAGDDAQLERLRRDYVPYLLAKVDYYDGQARTLFGRSIPQVLLLHANEINADTFETLAEALKAQGYAFTALEATLADPAYAHADGYNGRWGPSWIHRWAMAERKPRAFYGEEPATPRWVLDQAGVDSE
jgi:peptidoglycan/xylan/chitin deacetylase (PgdA/CDA1 family)